MIENLKAFAITVLIFAAVYCGGIIMGAWK